MLKEKQREINKDLIKNHKYPRSFKKGLRAPASTSRNKIAANPSKSRHQNANPGKQVSEHTLWQWNIVITRLNIRP